MSSDRNERIQEMMDQYALLLTVKEEHAHLSKRQRQKYEFVKRTLQEFRIPFNKSGSLSSAAAQNRIVVPVYSFNCAEHAYKLRNPSPLPHLARGLFVWQRLKQWDICLRGYDKFFNIGEVPETEWEWLETNTAGPYEVTVKENGCIIFAGSLEGNLIISSKHSLGGSGGGGGGGAKPSHAHKGREWLNKHLQQAGKTEEKLVEFLESHRVTAVFELADDEFEEHVLEYPEDRRGLFLHGINECDPEFITWETARVASFAAEFGFPHVKAMDMTSIIDVKSFADECRKTGSFDGRAIEGFVIRCKNTTVTPHSTHFFKIKYDEPYLMFREWREVTRSIIRGTAGTWKPRYELTRKYIAWTTELFQKSPILFSSFNEGKGIINIRNMFLRAFNFQVFGVDIVSAGGLTTEEFRSGKSTFKTEEELLESSSLETKKDSRRKSKSLGGGNSLLTTVDDDISSGMNSLSLKSNLPHTLIVPIAVIGAGKSTLGSAMASLYNIGHIQSDNISGKKAGNKFVAAIVDWFLTKPDAATLFADKNNHLGEHRFTLITQFYKYFPNGRVVALYWNLDDMSFDHIIRVSSERVVKRGYNHQTLTPKFDYERVIRMFVRSRQPLDRSKPYDKGITDVVEMKLESPPFENLIAVCKTMGWKQPDPIEFDVLLKEIAATQVKSEPAGGFKTDENMDEAMSSREKKKAAKQQSKQLAKKQDSSGTQQKKLPPKEPNCDVICYYGICISGASCELLLSSINSALSSSEVTPCNGKSFFFLLQTKKRFSPNRFHITLAINPLRLTLEKNESFVKLSSELFAQYESGEAQRRLLEGEDSGGDGTNTNADLEFKTSHLVWDDRVMCLAIDRVSLSALKITSLNDHPHITIGTANPNIPPSESNLVLGRLAKGDVSVNTLPLSIILHGNIRPYRY